MTISARRKFIDEMGQLSQAFGLGKAPGRIYGYLFFSPTYKTLDDLAADLGISKGSACMSVRQLEALGAVEHIWIKGDRKNYYIANDYLGKILRKAFQEIIGRRLESLGELIGDVEKELNGDKDAQILQKRVARLKAFQSKTHALMNSPITRRFLK